jgi:hypothetical protein
MQTQEPLLVSASALAPAPAPALPTTPAPAPALTTYFYGLTKWIPDPEHFTGNYTQLRSFLGQLQI